MDSGFDGAGIVSARASFLASSQLAATGHADWTWHRHLRYIVSPSLSVVVCLGMVSVAVSRSHGLRQSWLVIRSHHRYYTKGSSCAVKMAEAHMEYSFEYQGNAPKLVYTPLTDKCYLTLTQGMQLGYGGNPYGPAGTGKTESVKALGQCLGRQVLVFNCDEEFDFKSMGRIFMGLIKCGAWGCFDEFNRLEEEVLSCRRKPVPRHSFSATVPLRDKSSPGGANMSLSRPNISVQH